MTRENKLALVLGFGLILFVGILISDHFSVARRQEFRDLSSRTEQLALNTTATPFIDMVAPQAVHPPAQNNPVPAVSGTTIPLNDPLMNGGSTPASLQQDPPQVPVNPQGSATGIIDPATNPSAAALGDVQPVPSSQGSTEPQHLTMGRTGQPQGPTQPADDSTAGGTTSVPGFDVVEDFNQPAVAYRFHDVAKGESLTSICKAEYGSASRVNEIAALNGLEDPNQLRLGQRLRLPLDPSRARDVAPANQSNQRKTGPADSTTPPAGMNPASVKVVKSKQAPPNGSARDGRATDKQAEVRTYTVKKGDSLSTIAKKQLGSTSRWRELYQLNKKVIDDPDNLQAGIVLALPPRNASSRG